MQEAELFQIVAKLLAASNRRENKLQLLHLSASGSILFRHAGKSTQELVVTPCFRQQYAQIFKRSILSQKLYHNKTYAC